jgi:hypothetical protein
MALQQHFGDTRRGAEVPIDLKRRVRVKQVAIDTAATLKLFCVNRTQGLLQ